jgi:hypothetical protein
LGQLQRGPCHHGGPAVLHCALIHALAVTTHAGCPPYRFAKWPLFPFPMMWPYLGMHFISMRWPCCSGPRLFLYNFDPFLSPIYFCDILTFVFSQSVSDCLHSALFPFPPFC